MILNKTTFPPPTPGLAARGAAPTPEAEEGRTVKLTKREIEVLTHVIQGKSNREVADALFVSKRIADFHLENAYQKLHVSSRAQAFRRATRLGLIPSSTGFVEKT